MIKKPTPGPWHVESDFLAYAVTGPKFKEGYFNCFENEADANLISAAPELLESLQEALAFPGSWDKRKAKAAIEKAMTR